MMELKLELWNKSMNCVFKALRPSLKDNTGAPVKRFVVKCRCMDSVKLSRSMSSAAGSCSEIPAMESLMAKFLRHTETSSALDLSVPLLVHFNRSV